MATASAARGKLDALLGASGPLAHALPGFAPRGEQVALARAVEASLVEGRPCLAEAGTGVGKTLAYLVPLVRWLGRHGGTAVISTHTLALQAQLVERDIPNLLRALPDVEIRAAVLKGRSNFLCLTELEAASGELWTFGDPAFKQIQRWASETDSGDYAELDFSFASWSDIAASADTCKGRECRFYDKCFYFKARKNADDCNLLVVNHALFFADLRLRRANPGAPSLLPRYDAVVFDEAHHVEEMATRAFGLEWGSRRVPQLVHRAKRVPGIEQDRLANIERLNQQMLDPFLQAAKAEAFMDEAFPDREYQAEFFTLRDELYANLNMLARELTHCADAATNDSDRDRAQGLSRTATRLSTELAQVTRPDEPPPTDGGTTAQTEYFRWYQTRRLRTGAAFTTLTKTPLDVAPLVRESLLSVTPRTILVSATLATGGGFDFLKTRLGLEGDDNEPFIAPENTGETEETPAPAVAAPVYVPPPVEIIEGSPFDYARNCLLYVPRRLGGPTGGYASGGSDSYTDQIADEVLRLVEAAGGRTFALFTSHRMLKAVEERLWGRCDYPLFVQGEMPNGRLVEAFIASGDGVLLGTSSFWEGVDVPGSALSCVIMDKLPFAAPDAPTQRARENAIKASGGDSFKQMSLPQAQMRLKQGFGRLLRTTTDRGVVAILDNRLWTKGYGRDLMNDLPPCPRTDDFADVQVFFAALSSPPIAAIVLPSGVVRAKML